MNEYHEVICQLDVSDKTLTSIKGPLDKLQLRLRRLQGRVNLTALKRGAAFSTWPDGIEMMHATSCSASVALSPEHPNKSAMPTSRY